MDLGLALPQFDFSVAGEDPLRWETVLSWARAAEANGYTTAYLADHLFFSLDKYGSSPDVHRGFDCLAGLAGLAGATDRIRLGSLVLCAPLRAPAVLAKHLATLDVLSGGRLEVGMGAGWYEPEFKAAGIPFESPGVRLRQLEDAIEITKAMFAGRWGDAPCDPRPLQEPRPPIVVGGRGDRLLDLVARVADGWNTVWAMTPAIYRQRLHVLEAACERAGRDPATIRRTIGLYTLVGEDEADLQRRFERLRADTLPGVLDDVTLEEWREGRLVGTVAQVAEQLTGWEALGVEEVVACFGALPFMVMGSDDLELLRAAQGAS